MLACESKLRVDFAIRLALDLHGWRPHQEVSVPAPTMPLKPKTWRHLFQGLGASVVAVLLAWGLGRFNPQPAIQAAAIGTQAPSATLAWSDGPSGAPAGSKERPSPPSTIPSSEETAEPTRWTDDLLLAAEECQYPDALRRALVRSGFHLCSSEASNQLSRRAAQAGGIGAPAVRSWARRRFRTRFALAVQCEVTARDLAGEPLGSPERQSAVSGVVTASVQVSLSRIDLVSAQRTASFAGSAQAFALDRGAAIDKAFDKVVLTAPPSLKTAGN